MAGRNGAGIFTVTNPDFVSGTTISSSEMDANFSDVATGITQSIAADGQTTITANLPMNSKKLTGLAAGSTAGDSVRYEQLDTTTGVKGADLTSAEPLVIGTDGNYFDVTGTVGIATHTVAADRHYFTQFDGACILTHNAITQDLPGEANITTAAGDVAEWQSTGANTVQCVNYTKADGTAVVGGMTASSTDTLTNKTIDANGTGNSITNIDVADLANGTDGELITWDAAGAPAVVAVGTATHVLTSNGAGAAPTFQAPAAGGSWTRLQTISTGSAASWDFETTIDATYDTYALVWHTIPATDNALLYARVQVAAAYPTSGYEWSTFHLDTTSMAASGSDSDGQFSMHSDRGQGNLATEGCAGLMYFHEPSSTTLHKMFHWTGYTVDTAANGYSTGGGGKYEGGTGAITGIKLYYSTGNIASGEATLYGIANS